MSPLERVSALVRVPFLVIQHLVCQDLVLHLVQHVLGLVPLIPSLALLAVDVGLLEVEGVENNTICIIVMFGPGHLWHYFLLN